MELVKKIVGILDDKKGVNIEVLKVAEVTALTEYMVLVTGTSSTHIKALAGYVEEILKKDDVFVHHTEGYGFNSGWILLDYGYVLVNVFEAETRETYSLDKIWAEAEKITF